MRVILYVLSLLVFGDVALCVTKRKKNCLLLSFCALRLENHCLIFKKGKKETLEKSDVLTHK